MALFGIYNKIMNERQQETRPSNTLGPFSDEFSPGFDFRRYTAFRIASQTAKRNLFCETFDKEESSSGIVEKGKAKINSISV